MTTSALDRAAYLDFVNTEQGLIDRKIFSDPTIFEMEMEQIFARAWLFAAHDVLIPNPGDFFLNFFGNDRVIVVRDNEGNPQVLINSCRHRGNAVCRADQGHATSFMCTYHGWTYDLQGRLVGVPGVKEVYHEELDRENWGLIRAAKVESYGGLIFATMDPDAPPLMDYLGEVGKLTIDYFNLAQPKKFNGVSKWSVPCNWKFAVDNIWDWYHVIFTHNSAGMAAAPVRGGENYAVRWSPTRRVNGKIEQREVVALGRYGHAIGGAGYIPTDRNLISYATAEERASLGPLGAKMDGFGGIFPNLWVSPNSLEWRIPISPTRTEQWYMRFGTRRGTGGGGGVGPSSMFDQDDAENWGLSTVGSMGTVVRRYPLHYAMGIGHGDVLEEEGAPPHMDSDNWTEFGQRWHYQNWAHWMAAENWDEIKRTVPEVPLGRI